MRVKILVGFLCVFILSIACFSNAIEIKNEGASGNCLIVYYFYGDIRCASCHKIEDYTKETIDKYFGKEIASGVIVYTAVNVDETENAHFVEEYQLYTKSVVLSLIKNGEEARNKNLVKIWEYLGNRTQFEEYEQQEIHEFLEEL